MIRLFCSIFILCLLSQGCRTLEPETDPAYPLQMPEKYSAHPVGHDRETVDKFWHAFGSDALNLFMEEALSQSYDLKILETRIAQAEARVQKENAAFFPDLGFSLGGQKKKVQVQRSHDGSTTVTDSHSFDAGLNASYTVDVFGEALGSRNAQEKGVMAAKEELRNAMHELTALISESWIDLMAVRQKKRILESQIKINQTLLDLQKFRYAHGRAKALDVSQQKEALAEASSQVPVLEKQALILMNTLAYLAGKALADKAEMPIEPLPEKLSVPETGIPAQLLENRADIKAAQMRLWASLWEVSSAKADLMPAFRLTAQALFSNGELDLLFRNWVATLTGTVLGPLFDGGLRRAEVERTKALAQEHLNLYTKTVAKAFIEVENSLVSLDKQQSYIALLEEELEVAKLTLKDAMLQYQNGQSSYLSYLVTWTAVQRLERSLVGERAVYIKEWIGLHRALGWASGKHQTADKQDGDS